VIARQKAVITKSERFCYRLCAAGFVLTMALGCDPQSNADLQAALTPAPTRVVPDSPYTLWGTVTESGGGRPLANVLVETTGRTTVTNENGFYEFRGQGRSELSFNRDGFERPGPFLVGMSQPTTIDTSMHRAIRSAAGPLSSVLFRDDPLFVLTSGPFSDWWCGPPCKLIRVAVPSAGRIRARVSWQPTDTEFDLFITQGFPSSGSQIESAGGSSGALTAERTVTSGSDALVYFGAVLFEQDYNRRVELPTDVPFTLTTSIGP
jgi:hypothetical protein